jgi:hypothetical protein
MKKSSLFLLSLVSVFLISSSSPQNKGIGGWSKSDISEFKKMCLGVKEVKDLGKTGVKLCDCVLDKSQRIYASYDRAISDEAGFRSISESCEKKLSSAKSSKSVKGIWSVADKKKFNDICLNNDKIKELGKPGLQLCDCMLLKAEIQFNNFDECNNDEATDEKIAMDCADEVIKMNEK